MQSFISTISPNLFLSTHCVRSYCYRPVELKYPNSFSNSESETVYRNIKLMCKIWLPYDYETLWMAHWSHTYQQEYYRRCNRSTKSYTRKLLSHWHTKYGSIWHNFVSTYFATIDYERNVGNVKMLRVEWGNFDCIRCINETVEWWRKCLHNREEKWNRKTFNYNRKGIDTEMDWRQNIIEASILIGSWVGAVHCSNSYELRHNL